MTLRTVIGIAVLTASIVTAQTSAAQDNLKVGALRCEVSAGLGLIIMSSKEMECVFTSTEGYSEHYFGTIRKFGLDIGVTNRGILAWRVLSPMKGSQHGALAGDYVGVAASATVAAGVGANALVGGFGRSVTLQPLSVEAQTGVALAAGVAISDASVRGLTRSIRDAGRWSFLRVGRVWTRTRFPVRFFAASGDLHFSNALEGLDWAWQRGCRPRRSRPARRERSGQTPEQVGFGTSGGEGKTHPAGCLDDAGGDLDQAQTQSGELGPRQVARSGNGVADSEHQPIGAGVQDEAHLIGDRRAARRAIGGELRLVQLDQVLGLTARAIEAVVKPFGRAMREIGDDEADVERRSVAALASMRAMARRSLSQDLAPCRVSA